MKYPEERTMSRSAFMDWLVATDADPRENIEVNLCQLLSTFDWPDDNGCSGLGPVAYDFGTTSYVPGEMSIPKIEKYGRMVFGVFHLFVPLKGPSS